MRPPGSPRTPGSGRAKGTPNKTTQALRDLIEQETDGVPVPVLLVRIGLRLVRKGERAGDSVMVSTGVRALEVGSSHAYPKLKAVEHSGAGGGPAVVVELVTARPAPAPEAAPPHGG